MKLTWYGHSAFRLDFGGTAILIDPFLSANPTWDGGWEAPSEGVSHVLLTHGHDDHVGDSLAIAQARGAQIVGAFELCQYLAGEGAAVNPGNHGGTIDCGSFSVTFVNALHSSAITTPSGLQYMGNPVGFVVTPRGGKALYHMGDTGIFGDMALIQELYEPKVGLVPIGDRFTMGAKEAALACKRVFDFETVVPCHYATFPPLDQSADKFLAEMGDAAGIVRVAERGDAIEI